MQWFTRKSFLLLTHKTYFHCYIITVTPFVLTILNPFTTSTFGKIWPSGSREGITKSVKFTERWMDGWREGQKDGWTDNRRSE